MIEDEETLAASVKRSLEADGFSVDLAHTGDDGLWMAKEGTYDAIICDILLPGLNGYEVCRQLRSDEVATPILMLTAKEGEYDEADAFDLGADDYLRKPFSHVVLVARLRSIIRRAVAPQQETISIGNLQLEPATQVCQRDGTTIDLTPREFAVLEALVKRSPNVVSKRELLNSVWGFDFDGDPNIAEVYVGYVRKKIDKPFDTDTIKTVRGLGYQITERK